jgi:DNA mismatch repair protein MutS2
MNERTLSHLNYSKMCDIFRDYAETPCGKRAFENLSPDYSYEKVEEYYNRCKTLLQIVEVMGPCPLEGVPDLEEVLRRLCISGVVLDSPHLLDITFLIRKMKEIHGYFQKAEDIHQRLYSPLTSQWETIPSLYPLQSAIEKAIDPTGYIRDSASEKLRQLRKKSERQKRDIQKTLDRMLQSSRISRQLTDSYLTIRNGRYVLPVKAGAKHNIQGIIHDQSQSHQTLFIEPMACVELNNVLAMVQQEIAHEEEAVRQDLTRRAATLVEPLALAWRLIGDLDSIHARVLFMLAHDATVISLRKTPGFNLKSVRHPLLAAQKAAEVIPIDLILPKGKQTLILSGVNAGGKTVALKTLGISLLMVKSGFPLLASPGSSLFLYEQLFTEIGDEQSIANDLSTFSAHILHVKNIIEKSGPETLVLIDEIGAGTGLSEGAALSLGILDVLGEKGASVVVTTHFEALKGYGASNPIAMNVSVDFDFRSQHPLYTLSYGVPGNSNAFETAERLGLEKSILDTAASYRQQNDKLLSNLMGEVEQIRHKITLDKREIALIKHDISSLLAQYRRTLDELTEKKTQILKQWRVKWTLQLKNQKEQFQELLNKVKASGASSEHTHAFRSSVAGEFNLLTRMPAAAIPFPEKKTYQEAIIPGMIGVGDQVYIPSIEKNGHVVSIKERQESAEVMTGGIRLQIPLNRLRRTGVAEKHPRPHLSVVRVDADPIASSELNVVGYRVEDALPEVDKFIDAALVHSLKEITIIHGIGTGRLRGAIRDFLSGHAGISNFADGDLRSGGKGITVVQLFT